jgi:hypothetical protein
VEPVSTKNETRQYKKTYEEFYKHFHLKGSILLSVCSNLIFLTNISGIITYILVGWIFWPIVTIIYITLSDVLLSD